MSTLQSLASILSKTIDPKPPVAVKGQPWETFVELWKHA